MSTLTDGETDADAVRATLSEFRTRTLTALFGDRLGLTLFCATLVVLGLTWRQAVVINDNYTVGNALVAVADGHLDLRRAAFGPGLATPGAVESNGLVYGRNYGHVFLALPVLLVLRGLAAVVDLRLLLAGGWALLLLWTLRGVGARFGHERRATLAGSGLALVVFLGSAALATDLPASWLPFLALQVVSVVAAGFVAVLVYRLVDAAHGGRIGVGAGVAAVLGTGAGFWATIPKRHVLVACLALAAAYALYRSRAEAGTEGLGHADVRYRAGAYATAGLAAWVAAPEGAILGLAVAAADLSTARRADLAPRALVVVGLVTVVAFLPFIATNLAIAGDVLEPPRQLPSYEAATGEASGGGSSSSGGATSTAGRSGGRTAVGLVVGQFSDGLAVILTEPGRAIKTFVRSGYTAWTGPDPDPGQNLSVLESAPVLGALLGTLVLGGRRLVARSADGSVSSTPSIRVTDAFAVSCSLLLTLAYMPKLPLDTTITVRYLVPMYPLLVYAVARLPAVRRAIDHRWQWAAWTYVGAVLLGGQLFLAGTTLFSNSVGESMQTHAVVNLTLATLLAAWAVAATLARRRDGPDRYDEAGAVLLGLAVGAGTVFVLLASVAYFSVGAFLLPLVPAL